MAPKETWPQPGSEGDMAHGPKKGDMDIAQPEEPTAPKDMTHGLDIA